MKYGKFGDLYVVCPGEGEDLVAALDRFAAEQRIDAAAVTGTGSVAAGALLEMPVGPSGPVKREVEEPALLVGLSGLVALEAGRPAAVVSTALLTQGGTLAGGRLLRGPAGPGCELQLRLIKGYLQRIRRGDAGYAALDL